jgi:hypothetical protein
MRSGNTVQLELSLFGPNAEDERHFILTRVLKRHPSHKRLLEKLHYVRRYFPELERRTIKVGLTRAASGMAVPGGTDLWFNPTHVSFHTIAHEFVHLLQGDRNFPRSERSCDLFSLARHWTLNDRVPHYVKIPRCYSDGYGKIPPDKAKLLYRAAVTALRRRDEGERNYIALFENMLDGMAGASTEGLMECPFPGEKRRRR